MPPNTYRKKSNPNVRVEVHEKDGKFVVVEVGSTKGGFSGFLLAKVNANPAADDYVAMNALVIDSMESKPKGSGIGAILVYEYASYARRSGYFFLGIHLVAGTDVHDPSPRGFYYKMGFWDTLTTAEVKSSALYQNANAQQQAKLTVSLPMSGAAVLVAASADKSIGKLWERM